MKHGGKLMKNSKNSLFLMGLIALIPLTTQGGVWNSLVGAKPDVSEVIASGIESAAQGIAPVIPTAAEAALKLAQGEIAGKAAQIEGLHLLLDASQKSAEAALHWSKEGFQVNFSKLSEQAGHLAYNTCKWALSNWRITVPIAMVGALYLWHRYDAQKIVPDLRLDSNTAMIGDLDKIILLDNSESQPSGVVEELSKSICTRLKERYETPYYSYTNWLLSKFGEPYEHPRVIAAKQLVSAGTITLAKQKAKRLKTLLTANN